MINVRKSIPCDGIKTTGYHFPEYPEDLRKSLKTSEVTLKIRHSNAES